MSVKVILFGDLSDETGVDINEWILCIALRMHLAQEQLNEPIFSIWMMHGVIKSSVGKRPIQSPNHTNEKVHWYTLRFHIAVNLLNCYYLVFCMVSKMNIHNYLFFYLGILCGVVFSSHVSTKQRNRLNAETI